MKNVEEKGREERMEETGREVMENRRNGNLFRGTMNNLNLKREGREREIIMAKEKCGR